MINKNVDMKKEIIVGVIIFLIMVYIIVVNLNILFEIGMFVGVFVIGICLVVVFGCILMGVVVNFFFVLVLGMGFNVFFVYIVVL